MNYDIELPNPFSFGIKISEIEDRLPSIGCEVALTLEFSRGVFSYSAKDIWFECSVLDEFLAQLKGLEAGIFCKAEFYDIDREIVLSFTKEEIDLSVHLIDSEIGTGHMEFKRGSDHDMVIQYIEHLEGFAKWW
ncbi:hypothetical protein [Neptuniibacter sp. QD34_54]|uniref:hypothetical protein n=1 Tax=Neptuniibacter sp. QD34_54 TaxID=3398208 RepID=UPI0039F5DA9E